MYGDYQGAFNSNYGNQHYGAPTPTNPYQQAPQQNQNYYTGVNPYANYGYGGQAPMAPPPPPPPQQVGYDVPAHYRTFPSHPTKLPGPTGGKFYKGQQQQGGYNGYDAAVYNYAKTTQNNKWGNKSGHGGARKFGGTGDSTQYYCEVCKVSCAGQITYKEHLEGQKHKKKEALIKQGALSVPLAKNKLSYRCDLCEVTCTGQDTYNAHVRGSKHVKTVQLHKKLGKFVPEDVPTIIAPGEDGPTETKAKPKWHQQTLPGSKRVIGINTVNFVGGTKLSSTGQLEQKQKEVAEAVGSVGKAPAIDVEDEKLKAMMAAEEVKPVGEEHVEEERDATGKLIQYHCKLCDCKFSDPNAKEIHIKGRRHRLSYRQKIDPTIVVDMKQSTKKAAEKKKAAEPVVSSNFHSVPWFAQPAAESREMLVVDEKTVEAKYIMLNPGKEFVDNIEKLVCDVNFVLKNVSEKVERATRGLEEAIELPEDPSQPRVILGVARVGTIAKNTYIKGETLAEFVLSCTPVPTLALIQQVKEAFAASTTELTISEDSFSPVCLLISAPYFPEMRCRLFLTSTAVRSETAEETDCPDKATCLRALAYIRNTKYFDSHCAFLNSCQHVIRLFRDARSRYEIFSAFEDYTLELLIANIIDSIRLTLNPSEAFKRVLEALSSGILYTAILEDPCETDTLNLLDSLTDDQKHRITCCAQLMLRKVAFNQLHEVLGIERIVVVPPENAALKRTLDANENGEEAETEAEPEVKKVRVEEENGESDSVDVKMDEPAI